MTYPPYGHNPEQNYGQNPYGQPQTQPSAGWGPPQGAGNRPPQQPGWGQPVGQPMAQPSAPAHQPSAPAQGWGQQAPAPAWGQPGPQPGWGLPPAGAGPQQQPSQPVPPTPVPEPEKREAALVKRTVLVSTTESIAGREIVKTLGEVVGVVTRPRDMRPQPDMAVTLTQVRQDAVTAMVDMAERAGAHAVVGLRFDGGKISDGATEITAYGTAVKLDRAPSRAATDTAAEDNQPSQGNPETDEPHGESASGEQTAAGEGPEDYRPGDEGQQNQQNPFVSF